VITCRDAPKRNYPPAVEKALEKHKKKAADAAQVRKAKEEQPLTWWQKVVKFFRDARDGDY
jgi:hypothetical protein